MKADFGKLKLEIYGESHSERIGMRLDGIDIGTSLDMRCVNDLLARRRAGAFWSTPRREEDVPVFVGARKVGERYIVENARIEAYIVNGNVKSGDYDNIRHIPRPSHADLAVWAKEGAIPAGGGAFSGRMTAPLCIAGGIAKELLEKRGIRIDAYLTSVAGISFAGAYDYDGGAVATRGLGEEQRANIRERELPVLDNKNIQEAKDRLRELAAEGDSAGGVIECVISDLHLGETGGALFDGIEGKLSYALFGVPAVKGVEFGKGFSLTDMAGSCANDPIGLSGGKPAPLTNNSGGINGGISNGLPVILRVAVRPTPSIKLPQRSVDLDSMEERTLEIKGRHDVCIAPRAVPVIEAASALALYGML